MLSYEHVQCRVYDKTKKQYNYASCKFVYLQPYLAQLVESVKGKFNKNVY